MFIEFKSKDGKGKFLLSAFHIVSVEETSEGGVELITTDIHNRYFTCEKYKDVSEKLSTI